MSNFMPFVSIYAPKKKWLRFKRASTYYWELRCYANCCLRPPSRPWVFSFPDPDLLIFTKISVNPGKSLQMWQVCYRLADPKCQCLSSALAGLTSYSKRNHQGKSRFAAGMEPEVGADKNQCPWNSSLFGHVFFSP